MEPADPIETALAEALQRASIAGEWSTVATLARELEARLEARREARANVVSLASARKRRGTP